MEQISTLIELYDDNPLKNVLSTEFFRPRKTIFVVPERIKQDTVYQENLRQYFAQRNVSCKLKFVAANLYDASAVRQVLGEIIQKNRDCVLEVSGGTDAALFASGELCNETGIPAFTYSRKQNCFYQIKDAPFEGSLPCDIRMNVRDWFYMAGGSMSQGRVDNGVLDKYMYLFDDFFRVYMENRKEWNNMVAYMQQVSQPKQNEAPSLSVSGPYAVKGTYGKKIYANEKLLRALQGIGLISMLKIDPEEGVSFELYDLQVRTWLRDIGSVLELYVYKHCRDLGRFDDVVTSAVVQWQNGARTDAVTNEIDVMASRGIRPVFISCKTCDVKTEALNELAILRDRFGGEQGKAAIVTCERGKTVMRHRAMELGIDVIDLDDLKNGRIKERLEALIVG